jgi:hypothetical protein
MDLRDREALDTLFRRLARVAQRSGPRDRGAEALIQCEIAAQPAAPYYMAQTIIMQEKALVEAEARIEQLEARLEERDGTGLGARGRRAPGPWDPAPGAAPGGFLAGAAQTALAVTGGVLLGNMLADWLMPGGDAAAGPASLATESADSQADAGDFTADFDFGDI